MCDKDKGRESGACCRYLVLVRQHRIRLAQRAHLLLQHFLLRQLRVEARARVLQVVGEGAELRCVLLQLAAHELHDLLHLLRALRLDLAVHLEAAHLFAEAAVEDGKVADLGLLALDQLRQLDDLAGGDRVAHGVVAHLLALRDQAALHLLQHGLALRERDPLLLVL